MFEKLISLVVVFNLSAISLASESIKSVTLEGKRESISLARAELLILMDEIGEFEQLIAAEKQRLEEGTISGNISEWAFITAGLSFSFMILMFLPPFRDKLLASIKVSDDLDLSIILPFFTFWASVITACVAGGINVDDLGDLKKEFQKLKVELADLLVVLEREEQLMNYRW